MKNTCNKTSNNKYFDCPARMDDGRTFTDYRASSSVDDMIRYSNNVMNSYDYRQFLINNANNIMNVNNRYTSDKVGCNSCTAKEVPFNTECDINKNFSKCHTVDSNGVGLNNVVMGMRESFDGAGLSLTGTTFNGSFVGINDSMAGSPLVNNSSGNYSNNGATNNSASNLSWS